MTEPTDAELESAWTEATGSGILPYPDDMLAFARAVLARWGQPSGAGEPVAPDFYTACAWYEGGGESGWIALPGYSNETEHGVKHLILEAARKEGYKGTITGRLMELGWEIRPVYIAPQPTQAVPPAGREPLTEAQRNAIYDKHCFLGDNGWGINWWQVIDEVEAAHGIKGKEACRADR